MASLFEIATTMHLKNRGRKWGADQVENGNKEELKASVPESIRLCNASPQPSEVLEFVLTYISDVKWIDHDYTDLHKLPLSDIKELLTLSVNDLNLLPPERYREWKVLGIAKLANHLADKGVEPNHHYHLALKHLNLLSNAGIQYGDQHWESLLWQKAHAMAKLGIELDSNSESNIITALTLEAFTNLEASHQDLDDTSLIHRSIECSQQVQQKVSDPEEYAWSASYFWEAEALILLAERDDDPVENLYKAIKVVKTWTDKCQQIEDNWWLRDDDSDDESLDDESSDDLDESMREPTDFSDYQSRAHRIVGDAAYRLAMLDVDVIANLTLAATETNLDKELVRTSVEGIQRVMRVNRTWKKLLQMTGNAEYVRKMNDWDLISVRDNEAVRGSKDWEEAGELLALQMHQIGITAMSNIMKSDDPVPKYEELGQQLRTARESYAKPESVEWNNLLAQEQRLNAILAEARESERGLGATIRSWFKKK